MKLLSFLKLKRKRKTLNPSFRSYNSGNHRFNRRRPIIAKPEKATPEIQNRFARKKQRTKKNIFLIAKIFSALIVLISLIYVVFFSSYFNIKQIQIKGNTQTPDEESALSSYLTGYLGTNIFVFPAFKYESELQSQFTYLKSINIVRKLPSTLNVFLEPMQDIANIKVENDDGTTSFFIVNENGSISSAGSTDPTLPTIVMDLTSIDEKPELNMQIIDKEQLINLTQLGKDFEAKFKINVMQTEYLKRAREVHLYTERDFYVWLDLTQNLDTQLSKLKKSMTKLNIYEERLEYIDLRISGQNGEKVIYKLKEE